MPIYGVGQSCESGIKYVITIQMKDIETSVRNPQIQQDIVHKYKGGTMYE